jgi:SAM-dependent methyltransferase
MDMTTLAIQIAPQRSTQYAQLAGKLAPHELHLSPLAPHIQALAPLELGGQMYLKATLSGDLDLTLLPEMGMLALSGAVFAYYDRIGELDGPFLKPLDTAFTPFLPMDMVMTRRYRGKTNEMFTHFLCNVARYSSAFAHRPWSALRVLDPLAGGGTTLLLALALGADVVGVEQNTEDVQTTIAFIRQYAQGQGIRCQVKPERLRKVGQRWWCTLGKEQPRQLVYASGDTAQVEQLIMGFKKPHLIVTDLPYGVQHYGAVIDLLTAALPAWAQVLAPGGVLAFAWDATRLPRSEMLELVQAHTPLQILAHPPYDQLAHQVDRVIKRRDVIVARQPE